jgi:hypothetical protein
MQSSAPGGHGLPSRNRRRVAVAAVCAVLAAPGWAAAAADVRLEPATVVDPITDHLTPVTETVKEVVEPIVDTVGDTATPVTEPVRDTARPATDAAGELTRPVTDDLPTAPDPVREVIDDSGLLRDGGLTDDRVTDAVTPRMSGDRPRSLTSGPPGAPSVAEPRRAAGEQRPGPTRALPGVDRMPTPVIARTSGNDSLAEIIEGLRRTSRQFSFPLTIAALVLLFLGVQGRLDARDPKLAARDEDEELAFV